LIDANFAAKVNELRHYWITFPYTSLDMIVVRKSHPHLFPLHFIFVVMNNDGEISVLDGGKMPGATIVHRLVMTVVKISSATLRRGRYLTILDEIYVLVLFPLCTRVRFQVSY